MRGPSGPRGPTRVADPLPGREGAPRRWRAVIQTLLVFASLVAVLVPLHECATGRRDQPHAQLIRGPYLQLQGPDEVTVIWETNVPAGCSLDLESPRGKVRHIPGGTSTRCVIAVDDLLPGARYEYVPWADDVALDAKSEIRTLAPGEPFSFLVFGDSGSGGPNQLALAEQIRQTDAAFIIHTGDVVYPRGRPEDYDARYFKPYREVLRRLVLWPALGNHDVQTNGGAAWRSVFETPANNPVRSPTYYSFDAGNVHVTVLNSNTSTSPGSTQHAFLDHDLSRSPTRWKIVVFHHTIYSSGRHGSRKRLRDDILPVLEQHHVDLVFMGHDHSYERTKPLRQGQVADPSVGTTYVTTGGGGGSLHAVGWSGFTAYSESSPHFVRVRVDGEHLHLEMIRADGSIGDAADLVRHGSPAPISVVEPRRRFESVGAAGLVHHPTAAEAGRRST